ncbi:AraC family transcriptional regulator [Nakamurella sp.]|uniref:AraC family transcriptional regulator n=1 Tax=Nakamurella sp. TaxID=1869182 RepID=UPI003B3B451A
MIPERAASTPLSGRSPAAEIVVPDLSSSVRWHQHDFPHPLARWHTHPEVEVHLIRRSSGLAFVGDHIGPFKPGHVVLVGSHLPHNWISDLDPGELVEGRDVVLQIDPARIDRLAEDLPEAAEATALFESADRGIEYTGHTAARAAVELELVGASRGLHRLHRVFGLLGILADAPRPDRRILSRAPAGAPLDAPAQRKVDTVLRYITDNLGGEVRLDEAARIVGMTPSALSRFFLRAAGCGFADTVRRLRVIRACTMLFRTDRPVAEICFEAGYQNLSNFNRQFRAETGMTPRDYRRSIRTGTARADLVI